MFVCRWLTLCVCVLVCVWVCFPKWTTQQYIFDKFTRFKVVRKKIIFETKRILHTISHARILFTALNTFYHMALRTHMYFLCILYLKRHTTVKLIFFHLLFQTDREREVSRMKSFNFRSYEWFMPIKIPFCTVLLYYSWLCVFYSRHFDGSETGEMINITTIERSLNLTGRCVIVCCDTITNGR